MSKCLVCNRGVESIMSFGNMPIANAFLTPDQFDKEYFYDLRVGFCPGCCMVQLLELVDRQKLFHENYAYFSSTSTFMTEHFKNFASDIRTQFLTAEDPFVVEIGSNDGIMLRHFAQEGVRHLGVEPSANVAKVSLDKGIHTICRFFDAESARDILDQHGPADVIAGANVMCHLPYLHSVIEGVEILLKSDGVLVFEDPYLLDIINKTSYDQIYDEHAFYFSILSLNHLFAQHGMEIVDVRPQDVHGGSMRYTVAKIGTRKRSKTTEHFENIESTLRLNEYSTYTAFRENVRKSKKDFLNLLAVCKREGNRIAGYGATSKSTTVLNYCRIDSDLVEFISDTTPAKQGKCTPGMHIPVKPYDEFLKGPPDYAVLFAWNHEKEILSKERRFIRNGGKFIVYVPNVKIVP